MALRFVHGGTDITPNLYLKFTLKVEVKMWIPFLSFLTMSTLAIYELAYRASLMGWLDVQYHERWEYCCEQQLVCTNHVNSLLIVSVTTISPPVMATL